MHRDFDAVRRAWEVERDPVTFRLADETFTVLPDPTLGDTFELADAPDIDPDTFDGGADLRAIRVLSNFIRRMLPVEDRQRWDNTVLLKIPASQAIVIYHVAVYVTEQVTGHPFEPSRASSKRRATSGRTSKPASAGTSRSKPSRRAARSR